MKEPGSQAVAEMSEDGIGVTWQAFRAAAAPCPPLHRGTQRDKRRRDKQPQVSTSLADKSNLSPWPLTLEVAMEPCSRVVDAARWDYSQQGRANMGCCESY